ncbi:MAG: STAS domain-containing protein, partial [Pseudomonadota bacterium]
REVAEQARARLSDLIDRGERRIELDLTGISFIDSAGLYLGANLQKRLGEAGSVRLSGLSPTLRWMFALTQLDKVLEIRAAA